MEELPEQAESARLRQQVEKLQQELEEVHQANQELKRASLERILEPVIRDLAKLHDDYGRRREAFASAETVVADAEQVCADIGQDLGDVLERYGVAFVRPPLGAAFDRREHTPSELVLTTDPAEEGRIAAVRRPGLYLGDRRLRPAEVSILQFRAPQSAKQADEGEEQAEQSGSDHQ